MNSNRTKMLCLIAFTLIASGCGSGSGDSGDAVLTNPQLSSDGVNNTTEVANVIDTSDSLATPVTPVSSAQMDSYVDNPLVTEIPAELYDGSSTAIIGSYITNPLIN